MPACAGSPPARSPSSRARKSGGQPRPCSDGSASRRTSRTPSCSLRARISSRGRHSWWTADACSNPAEAEDRRTFVAIAIPLRTMRVVTSDGELIQRAATGDHSAFEDLYHRYARPVFGLALRRLGDRGRAEDPVQETFASIWRSAASYRPERGPGAPWLYAVARNAIVDRARSRTEIPPDIPDEAAAGPGPSDRAQPGCGAGREGGGCEEGARPRGVQERLVRAGRRPARPRGLGRPPPAPAEAEIVQFPLLPRRRWTLAAVAAIALVLLAFGGGYLVGHAKT